MMTETEKYQKVWKHDQYREVAPGEYAVDLFVRLAKPKSTDTITDYGCGTGRASLRLSLFSKVRMLDFTSNSLDLNVIDYLSNDLTFEQWDLTQPINVGFSRLGFCTDVMEHIPTDDVMTVLKNIVTSSRHVFFQISCVPDQLGALIGETLHLTVKPYSWWLDRFNELNCTLHFSEDRETDCLFYVTAWATGKDVKNIATVNTDDEQIRANILTNIKLNLPEVKPYEQQDKELIILAGGPSLNEYINEIKFNKRMGIPVVTMNGAYNWALDHGIKPDVQIILDAREFNKRFVDPIVPTCKYLIASQCHPALTKAIPKDQIVLWHSGAEAVRSCVEELGITRDIYPTYGGMTVMLRGLPLLIMLGYSKFVIYGFDSCLMTDDHHAYSQPENDYNNVLDVTCGDRVFQCHGWHLTQAFEFQELQQMIGDLCEMDVKGDGLIAHIIRTGSQLSQTM